MQNSSSDVSLIPREINEATEGLPKDLKDKVCRLKIQDNALTLSRFIISLKNEINSSINNNINYARALVKLSKNVDKKFIDITRDDLLFFLNSLKKPEPEDPLHKWIGTYNNRLVLFSRFFKWLFNPDLEANQRPKPSILDNISQLKRKEISTYKPSDLWTQEDDLLFLKYCPSKRDRACHMILRDTSCRPHEILGLRIKDITFKMAGERQYAEALVSGKTGSRPIPLINSIPYLKDYLDDHPQRSNPNAFFVFGEGKAFGKRLSYGFFYQQYRVYKYQFFSKLLEDPRVSPEDKAKIQELLKKPWNPYVRRHTALTEKSQILKEHTLRQHAGWSANSKMHLKYIHYFGNESNESTLEAYGIKSKSVEEIDKMKPKQCPNCSELNRIDSKFCVKCRMVLSYDSYIESIDKMQVDKSNELAELTETIKNMSLERKKDKLDEVNRFYTLVKELNKNLPTKHKISLEIPE